MADEAIRMSRGFGGRVESVLAETSQQQTANGKEQSIGTHHRISCPWIVG